MKGGLGEGDSSETGILLELDVGLAYLFSLTEQVRMGACALKHEAVYVGFVNEKPI